MKYYNIMALEDCPEIFKMLERMYTPVDIKMVKNIKYEWKEEPLVGIDVFIKMYNKYLSEGGVSLDWLTRTAELFEISGGFKGGKHGNDYSIPYYWFEFTNDLEIRIENTNLTPMEQLEKLLRNSKPNPEIQGGLIARRYEDLIDKASHGEKKIMFEKIGKKYNISPESIKEPYYKSKRSNSTK